MQATPLRRNREYLAAETLATEVREAELEDATYRQDAVVDGSPVRITIRRA